MLVAILPVGASILRLPHFHHCDGPATSVWLLAGLRLISVTLGFSKAPNRFGVLESYRATWLAIYGGVTALLALLLKLRVTSTVPTTQSMSGAPRAQEGLAMADRAAAKMVWVRGLIRDLMVSWWELMAAKGGVGERPHSRFDGLVMRADGCERLWNLSVCVFHCSKSITFLSCDIFDKQCWHSIALPLKTFYGSHNKVNTLMHHNLPGWFTLGWLNESRVDTFLTLIKRWGWYVAVPFCGDISRRQDSTSSAFIRFSVTGII